MSTNSYTKSSSIAVDSLSKKRSYVSDQAKFKKVRFNKNISQKSKPNFPSLDTLAKLQQSGKIQVIFPKQRLDHKVSTPSTAKNTNRNIQFFYIFVNFAQQFSHNKVENVCDLP